MTTVDDDPHWCAKLRSIYEDPVWRGIVIPIAARMWEEPCENLATVRCKAAEALEAAGYAGRFDENANVFEPASHESLTYFFGLLHTLHYGRRDRERWQVPSRLDSRPACELTRPFEWRRWKGISAPQPDLEELWKTAGGPEPVEGRMIAFKTHPVWAALGDSTLFQDGLDIDYPPFCMSYNFSWKEIARDEAEAFKVDLPAMPEGARDPNAPRFLDDPVLSALLKQVQAEEAIKPNWLRMKEIYDRSFEEGRKAYEEQQREQERERAEKDAAFRLLEQVEESLSEAPTIEDNRRMEWLWNSAQMLRETEHFERYPNWRARAWVVCAELHRMKSEFESELACLERALQINPRLPVKRRIKKLKGR